MMVGAPAEGTTGHWTPSPTAKTPGRAWLEGLSLNLTQTSGPEATISNITLSQVNSDDHHHDDGYNPAPQPRGPQQAAADPVPVAPMGRWPEIPNASFPGRLRTNLLNMLRAGVLDSRHHHDDGHGGLIVGSGRERVERNLRVERVSLPQLRLESRQHSRKCVYRPNEVERLKSVPPKVWVPERGKYLLAHCTYGRMSNQVSKESHWQVCHPS